MDLEKQLQQNKNLLDEGQISEDEYNQRREKIIVEWRTKKQKVIDSYQSFSESTNSKGSIGSTELYDILRVKPNSTDQDIKLSYRKLSLKHHPDKNGGVETKEWHKLSQAYEVLSDSNKRAIYDRFGTNTESRLPAFNLSMGGDNWLPYIGELELGYLLLSITTLQQMEERQKAKEITKLRHSKRISDLVLHLNNRSDTLPRAEIFTIKHDLSAEAKKLAEEPNGENLLGLLGNIYVTKSERYLRKGQMWRISIFGEEMVENLYKQTSFLSIFTSSIFTSWDPNSSDNEKIKEELVWKLTQSEISGTVREVCDAFLNDERVPEIERDSRAEFLGLLGKIWIEQSKKSSF